MYRRTAQLFQWTCFRETGAREASALGVPRDFPESPCPLNPEHRFRPVGPYLEYKCTYIWGTRRGERRCLGVDSIKRFDN